MIDLLKEVGRGKRGAKDYKRARANIIREDGSSELFLIDPEALGMCTGADAGAEGAYAELLWDGRRQAETIAAVLKGSAEETYCNMVILNSGIRLWVAQAAPSLQAGIEQAAITLRQGMALRYYEKWLEAVR
jgi:anthranilate phosphoribosyltransferase